MGLVLDYIQILELGASIFLALLVGKLTQQKSEAQAALISLFIYCLANDAPFGAWIAASLSVTVLLVVLKVFDALR